MTCEGITTNNYICSDSNNDTYKINTNNIPSNTNKYVNIDVINSEISLFPQSSNHYLIADGKAHCSQRWEDWFCIGNYHNNNRVNKSPNTETMAVGVCYKPCPAEYNIGKNTKCYKYISENDLIYNPLAIIAIFGTVLNRDSICNRGSYLNDLYRVNNNDIFIKEQYINKLLIRNDTYIKNTLIKNPPPLKPIDEDIKTDKINPTNQEIFLLQIIEIFLTNNNNINSIRNINNNIKTAADTFIEKYNIINIENNNDNKNDLLYKIKNYRFNINILNTIYGEDKNKKSKFINIISYAYNIAHSIFYDVNDNSYSNENVNKNITALLVQKNIDPKIYSIIILIFKNACYNCFNYNFELFKNYLGNWNDNSKILRIIIKKSGNQYNLTSRTFSVSDKYFKFFDKIDLTDKGIVLNKSKYTISYYNNLKFYDHYLLSEYSDNTRYIIQLLIIFGILFCIILFICFLYFILIQKISFLKSLGLEKPLIYYFVYYINYVHLFYKWITFNILRIMSNYIYWSICYIGKYKLNIINVIVNILNICILIYLVIYIITSIIELFKIDYIKLLANINYGGKGGDTTTSIVNHKLNSTIFYHLFMIYLISIFLYAAYLIRYSRNSSEYDIISNSDADDVITKNYLNNLLLSEYASNMLSNFNFIYTSDELSKVSKSTIVSYNYEEITPVKPDTDTIHDISSLNTLITPVVAAVIAPAVVQDVASDNVLPDPINQVPGQVPPNIGYGSA